MSTWLLMMSHIRADTVCLQDTAFLLLNVLAFRDWLWNYYHVLIADGRWSTHLFLSRQNEHRVFVYIVRGPGRCLIEFVFCWTEFVRAQMFESMLRIKRNCFVCIRAGSPHLNPRLPFVWEGPQTNQPLLPCDFDKGDLFYLVPFDMLHLFPCVQSVVSR